ncbi:hypothetical protein MVEN_01969300 [Mycena venus]|uniref:Uncharacterized protein n=1 Tax=Mycena venus TaxID=2733690 RepID=A0A8H6XE87_9AGAR|nr:hypothetical protein MVEN_01969300 [Mycena venus]
MQAEALALLILQRIKTLAFPRPFAQTYVPMARPAIPRATQIVLAIICIVLLVFCLALPDFSKQKFFEGTTTIILLSAIFRLYVLARDVHPWLTAMPPSREHSLSEIESAVPVGPPADRADQVPLATSAPPTFSEGSQALQESTSGKLIILVFHGVSLFMGFLYGSAISSQQSALENTVAALMFVLGGLEVLFVGLLVGLFVVWLTGPGAVRVVWKALKRRVREDGGGVGNA